MRVTLVNPPTIVTLTNYLSTVAMAPVGPAYIAAQLRRAGHDVEVVDGTGSALEHFEKRERFYVRGLSIPDLLDRIHPDTQVIGLGCMFTPQWILVRELVNAIKQRFPHATMVLGGEHPTGLPEYCLQTSPADVIVLGEGERIAVDLLEALDRGTGLEDVLGIVYRGENGEIRINPRAPRIRDVDALPWPAWDLFPIDEYIENGVPHGARLGRAMPMLATRGCPYQCTYCSSPQMWTTRWFARSVRDVVDEMVAYQDRYGADDFHFEDLTFVIKRDWIIAFCREVVERGLVCSWQLPSGTRSEAIDEEVIEWMKRAGCKVLSYAPESGSTRLLKDIKKKINIDRMLAASRPAIKHRLRLQANMLIAYPGETWRDVFSTYWLLFRMALLGFQEINLSAFYPLPNTEIWHQLRREGKLVLDDDFFLRIFRGHDPRNPASWNPLMSDGQLRIAIWVGYLLFFFTSWITHPWRPIRLIFNTARGKSATKFERIVGEFAGKALRLRRAEDKTRRGIRRAQEATPVPQASSPVREPVEN
jgi:radical SAM superfamily enzyme YgiQ (UPF0313 family)